MMKHLHSTLFVLFFVFSCSQVAFGQSWLWGAGSRSLDSGSYDEMAATMDRNGNVFVAGQETFDTISFGAFSEYSRRHTNKMVVTKTDTTGHFRWMVGNHNPGNAYPCAVTTDRAGNLYIYGTYDYTFLSLGSDTIRQATAGNMMAFLSKVDTAGNVTWLENLGLVGINFGEGTMGMDSAGYLYLSGTFNTAHTTIGSIRLTNVDTTTLNDEVFIARVDPSGNVNWAKCLHGKKNETVLALDVVKDGHFYISGNFTSDTFWVGTTYLVNNLTYSTAGYRSALTFLARFDDAGNTVWAKSYPNLSFDAMTNYGNNDLYLTGQIDSGMVLGGDTLTVIGYQDAVVLKIDSSGTCLWSNSGGAAAYISTGQGVSVDSCKNIFVCGGGAGFGLYMVFGHDTLAFPPTGADVMFIAMYNDSGRCTNVQLLPSGGDDFSRVMPDNRGNYVVAGDYDGAAMPFGPDTLAVYARNLEAMFVARYHYSNERCITDTTIATDSSGHGDTTSFVRQLGSPQPTGITIYPNPASQEVTIHMTGLSSSGGQADLIDAVGQTVASYQLSGNDTQISVAGLLPGIYLCRVHVNEQMLVRRVVVLR